jgi:hypothetical protein
MKVLIFALFFGILMAGCSKEKPIALDPVSDIMKTESAAGATYSLIHNSDSKSFDVIEMSPQAVVDPQARSGVITSDYTHVYGRYHTAASTVWMRFTATSLLGSTIGLANFKQNLTLPFPPFSGVADFNMDAVNITVLGNEVIYEGIITEVISDGGFPPGGPFTVGNYYYFRVIDNTGGTTDQIYNLSISSPTQSPDSGLSFDWATYGFMDVDLPGDKVRLIN